MIELLQDKPEHVNRKIQKIVKDQLMLWIDALTNYIKAHLPIPVCESCGFIDKRPKSAPIKVDADF